MKWALIKVNWIVFFLFITLFVQYNATGQSLAKSRQSSYFTYIFQIEPSQAKEILTKERYLFPEKYLQHKIDSFPTDSGYNHQLEIGHYLYVMAKKNQLIAELVSINSIEVDVLNNNRDLMLFIHNLGDNHPIANAEVQINNKRIPYHPATETYQLSKSNKQGLLSVEVNGEILFYELIRDYNNPTIKRLSSNISQHFPVKYLIWPFRKVYYAAKYNNSLFGRRSRYPKQKGYIAFNKPQYLPLDTLKWKAFVTNRNGKPFHKPIKVLIASEYGDHQKILETKLKPVTKGAYMLEVPLGDSLKLNTSYVVNLLIPKSDKYIMSNSFYLEDYQLDESDYELRVEKDTYHPHEKVHIFLSGKDANGFNLLDSRVKLTIYPANIHDYVDNKVFIADQLWTKTIVLDPLGETKITIPDSIFPAADLDIRVEAIFNNSNNETHVETGMFLFNGANSWIGCSLKNDSVYANLFVDGEMMADSGSLYLITDDEIVEERRITFPFKEKVNPQFSMYEFSRDRIVGSIDLANEESLFSCHTNRTPDTAYIWFENPRKLPIHFTIFNRNNQPVDEGTSVDFDKRIAAKDDESYFVSCQFIWGGLSKNQNREIFAFRKNLNIDIDQPALVYPGQQVDVVIKVTDFEDQPVEDVNITAGAINSQFKNNHLPQIPYLGKYRRSRPTINSFELQIPDFNSNKWITPFWYKKMHLDSIPYYQIIYPEKGIKYYYDSAVDIRNAQFAPYLYQNGEQQPLFMIYIDSKLIYFAQNDNNLPYSFVVDEGPHTVKLRAREKEYIIDSVCFLKGTKLDLVLDEDSVPAWVKSVRKPDFLTPGESSQLNECIFQVKNNFSSQLAYIWQNDLVIPFYPYRNYQSLYELGPFKYDSIHFALSNRYQTNIIFEPGYEYTIEKGLIKMTRVNRYCPKQSLPNRILVNRPGQIAYPIPIELKTPQPAWEEKLITPHPQHTNIGNGTLKFEYPGDRLFSMMRLSKRGTGFKDRFYEGKIRQFYDLYPGWYQLLFIIEDGIGLLKDSIFIQANGINFERFDDPDLKLVESLLKPGNFMAPILLRNDKADYAYGTGNGKGAIKGKVRDKDTKEPIPFVNLILYAGNIQITGATSDFDGNYEFRNIPEGSYELKVAYIGYTSTVITDLYIVDEKIRYLDIDLESSATTLDEVVVACYGVSLISKDQTSSGSIVTAEEILKMPNRSTNAVATTVGGVYSKGSEIYVDGIKGIGNAAIQTDEFSSLDDAFPSESSGLRNDFSDYAYWQPNLITNAEGEVSFKATFPDNITQWESFVLAMDGKKHSGIGKTRSKAYKPLMGQLATPRFLIVGDQSQVIGKTINYTSSPEKITSTFMVNNNIVSVIDTVVENAVIEHLNITANKNDSLRLTYQVQNQDNYLDGEERVIPVFPAGIKETIGTFHVLSTDTTLQIPINTLEYPLEIYAQNNSLAPMLEELKQLEDYPYFCMEQSASKLIGLLMDQNIQQALGALFNKKGKIKKLIRSLQSGQNDDGGWGWWPSSTTSTWMTSYVMKALNLATQNGYQVNDIEKAKNYLKWNLDVLRGDELLYAINTLSEMKVDIPYASYLKKISQDSLSGYQKLMVIRIKQSNRLDYSMVSLLASVKKTYLGNYYWGDSDYLWYDNKTNMTLLAYQIIENNDSLHPYLSKIRNYFLETKSHNHWQNTIEKAQILATILRGMMREYGGQVTPATLKIKGPYEATISEFPFRATIKNTEDNLMIQKSGNEIIYLTTYQKSWNTHPTINDSLFAIETWFERDGMQLDSLTAGETVELKVSVTSRNKGDYIIIEVPVPAGCSYGDNSQNTTYTEVHREYFKNKTSIFCEHLNPGNYIFTISLQPRFSGNYTLNPAKAELMYFPVFSGRNELKKTVIHDSTIL